MKKLKKAVLAVLSAVLVVGNINAVFADGDISVRMNGIVSNDVSYINFTDTKPIQIDNRTLTPARAMAEAAGMEVEWDQPTQTALLTLKADANSDRPIAVSYTHLISRQYGGQSRLRNFSLLPDYSYRTILTSDREVRLCFWVLYS